VNKHTAIEVANLVIYWIIMTF